MAGAFSDRVLETSTSTGAGDFTLAGATTGYITFNSAFGTGAGFKYCIEAVDANGVPTGEWEVGRTSLSASTTLVRGADTIVEANSAGTTTLITFSAGTKNVFCPFSGLASRKSTHGFDLQYGMP